MDERAEELEGEEVAEAIRARQARQKFGGVFAVFGLAGFLGFTTFFVVTERDMGVDEAAILGTFVAFAVVGAGYMKQFEGLSSLWKR